MTKWVIVIVAVIIVIAVGFVAYSFLKEPEATTGAMEALPISAVLSGTMFEIVSAESEARFLINEVLRGDPVTVVGSTDQVAGQLAVDPGDLSSAQSGIIQVNTRTLATDNQFRNRAIKNRILLTDDHEFVTFAPTEVVGPLARAIPFRSWGT